MTKPTDKPTREDVDRIVAGMLSDVADRISSARHGFDHGDMDAETAFDCARDAIASAIKDTVHAHLLEQEQQQ